ncbi:hypothetical protein [Bacteroides thetaiotaomicron]|jgi:putative uncharacterized protein (fragment)|uniref:plasmid mobilization protein n=1 Tax=Bacteroides thetaiotaomicron TaxID=818 RepID=UPI0035684B0E
MKTREKGRKKKDEGLVKETRVGFRLSPEELIELERLVYNAEAKNRTEYIKAAIFRREIRVTKVDAGVKEYWKLLNNIQAQYRKFGINYNQVVKILHTTFEEKKALAFLYKLENITIELVNLNKEIIELTKKIEKEWLQK